MRAALESLLRARKLDVTLTTADAWTVVPPDRLAATGDAELDRALGGGLRRGHLSEITGSVSSGRTTLMTQMLAAATGRGEVAAVVDVCDTFDPASVAARGVDLARVLWVRDTRDAVRGLKAFSLILQAGGFGLVVFDLADVPAAALRRFPHTTWMRIARTIEGAETVALLAGSERIARSPGGVTIALTPVPAQWVPGAHRARLLTPITPVPRVVRAR
jgi:recA bacterial DNA recombination protein